MNVDNSGGAGRDLLRDTDLHLPMREHVAAVLALVVIGLLLALVAMMAVVLGQVVVIAHVLQHV